MRLFLASLVLALTAAPLAAQQAPMRNDDPDNVVKGSGTLPAGWRALTDRNAPVSQLSYMAMGKGFHAVMGPAAVFYNPAQTKTGNYKVSATFTQNKAPAHPESYGLFIGGKDLGGQTPQYTYFLVRGGGEYFIAKTTGTQRTVIQNWTASPAVRKQDATTGKQVNVLGAEVRGSEVIFTVNGTEVARQPKSAVGAEGMWGWRINHNLDVYVEPAK